MPDPIVVDAETPAPIVVTVTPPPVVAVRARIGLRGVAGPPGPAGAGDLNAAIAVSMASATWVLNIPAPFIDAGKVPDVAVYDTADNKIDGFGTTYDPVANTLTLTFTFAFAGVAYLN